MLPSATSGFSLVELLVVVALVALLTSLGSSVLSNMAVPTARSTAEAIAGNLEFAQAKATALAGYTRLAFGQMQLDGGEALVLGIFVSKTGTPSTAAADWQLLRPPTIYPNMAIGECAGGNAAGFAAGDLAALSARVRGTDVTFRGGVIISPSGAFRATATGGFSRELCARVENKVKPSEAKAAISLAAVSGPPQLVYPAD